MKEKSTRQIHPTAVVSPGAELKEQVTVGPYAVIEDGVRIGSRTRIGAHSVIKKYTNIGSDCSIGEHSVLGGVPQDTRFKGEPSYLDIHDGVTVGEFAALHRATGEGQKTEVGRESYIMAYAHVSHNCKLGMGVTAANGVQLAGYVEVGDGAFLGGMAGVHQFVRIGRLAMVGAHSYLSQDLPPFLLGAGHPFRVFGLNRVGLERAGISARARSTISRLYRLIYLDPRPRAEALAELPDKEKQAQEVIEFLEFIKKSKRGILLKTRTRTKHETD